MNYTKQLKKALDHAGRASKKMDHNYIGTEHLLIGLIRTGDSLAARILLSENVDEEHVIALITDLIAPQGDIAVMERDGYTPKLKAVLELAEQEASASGAPEVGTEHALMAILRTSDCAGARLLSSMDVNLQKTFNDVLAAMGSDGETYRQEMGRRGRMGFAQGGAMLEMYTNDLTAKAAAGELDPIIGRETEISRVIQVLSRRTKNNPCLIGEPGVGKTAIVEGLAERIYAGGVPDTVAGKRVLSLDLSGMVAGSKYRGEFEERIKNVMNEIIAAGDVLLFIDEMHTLIGAGGAEGSLDAANILKPAMARGDLQIIGATTLTEYRKYVEKDAALERRFQPVTIEEPSVDETKEILLGIRDLYEQHHNILITPEAIDGAVELSERYVSDRFLPDKAIDLMDEAAARMRMGATKSAEHIYEMEEQIRILAEKMEAAIIDGQMEDAHAYREEREHMKNRVEKLRLRQERQRQKKKLSLTYEDVADVVYIWTKIPVSKLVESETKRLQNLEKTIHKRVIGQEDAVSAVARAVRRGRVGLKEPGRPIGSFLFLGPTGVGKTEISKVLAEAMFGSEDNLIRVDMTEYMEKHSVSKMIGSPPGYVGYEEGGQLSEKVRRNPYSVILFDEIEKAHGDVFNVLLQVLDDGHITDAQGRKVDFKNTIIIMTSNAGAKEIMEPKKLGFSQEENEEHDYEYMKGRVMEELKQSFKPEFLNRIDETIVFRALNKEDMKKIVGIMTKSLVKRCREQMDISLSIPGSVKTYIVEKAYDPKFGARPLRRKIQTDIEDVLTEEILEGTIGEGDKVTATVTEDKISFKKK
mgnify:CR=1 FL=1